MVSSDIVGYSYVNIPTGWSMFTPVFKNVEGKSITLADITVCNPDKEEFDDARIAGNTTYNLLHQSRNRIVVRKINNKSGDLGSSYFYTSNGYSNRDNITTWGWGANATLTLSDSDSIIINNTQGTNVLFMMSGAVELAPVATVPMNWSVVGNNTPVDITLGDITVLNLEGNEFDDDRIAGNNDYNTLHQSRNRISVRKLRNNDGNVGSTCFYTSNGYANRETSATWGWGANKGVVIASGEAILVNNTQGAAVQFKLPNPTTK